MTHRAVGLITALALGAGLAGCAGGGEAMDRPSPSEPTAAAGQTSAPAESPVESTPASPSENTTPEAAVACDVVTPLTVLLTEDPGARYAGLYAAQQSGAYERACLDVTLVDGQQPGAISGDPADPQVAIWTVPQGLAAREAGIDATNVAQVMQRSGLRQVSWVTDPVTTPADFRDRRVGLPDANGYEVIAATSAAGLDPVADVALRSPGGYRALLADEVDAAAVQSFDGYVRLLDSVDPATSAPVTEADLVTLDYEASGWALMPDGIWAQGAALSEPSYRDAVLRFITASLRGWVLCRDDVAVCAQAVHAVLPDDSVEQQQRMVDEVNKLIWPSPAGIGAVDESLWSRTVAIGLATKSLDGRRFITAPPTTGAYSDDLASVAREALAADGLSTTG